MGVSELSAGKEKGLIGLDITKLEEMRAPSGEMFFTGHLGQGVIVVMRRAEGLSAAGRHLWQLSFARKKHNADTGPDVPHRQGRAGQPAA